MTAAAAGRPLLALADDREALPLERIMAAAELVGLGTLDGQAALLDDADPAVRWWAVIGLLNQPQSAERDAALRRATSDADPRVAGEAALALLNDDADAGPLLLKQVLAADEGTGTYLCRACVYGGPRAAVEPILVSVRDARPDLKKPVALALQGLADVFGPSDVAGAEAGSDAGGDDE